MLSSMFTFYSPWTDKELEAEEWRTLALQRIAKILRTHVVKFDFDDSNIFDKGREFTIIIINI